jgi:hypothetical protein
VVVISAFDSPDSPLPLVSMLSPVKSGLAGTVVCCSGVVGSAGGESGAKAWRVRFDGDSTELGSKTRFREVPVDAE